MEIAKVHVFIYLLKVNHEVLFSCVTRLVVLTSSHWIVYMKMQWFEKLHTVEKGAMEETNMGTILSSLTL